MLLLPAKWVWGGGGGPSGLPRGRTGVNGRGAPAEAYAASNGERRTEWETGGVLNLAEVADISPEWAAALNNVACEPSYDEF